MRILRLPWLIFIYCILRAGATAQPPGEPILRISKNDPEFESKKYDLTPYLYVLTDPVGEWTIEDVSSEAFQQKFRPDSLNLLGTWTSDSRPGIKATWSRLTIHSGLDEPLDWLINLSAGKVDFFAPDGKGGYSRKQSGSHLPLKDRHFRGAYGNLPFFPVTILPGATQTVYFKTIANADFHGNRSLEYFNRLLFAPEVYSDFDRKYRFSKAIILGILMAVAFYHLIIFLFHRNPVFLYFSLFVIPYALIFASFSGHASEFLLPDSDKGLGIVFVGFNWPLAFLFFYLFSRSYLRLKMLMPLWDKIWAALVLVRLLLTWFWMAPIIRAGGLANIDIASIAPRLQWLGIISILLFTIPFITAIGTWIKGNRNAGVYLLALALFIYQQVANGVNYYTSLRIPVLNNSDLSIAASFLLFSLGIAGVIRSLDKEKAAAEKSQALMQTEASQVRAMDEFKTRFYTNITHEFRTPLTIILGVAEQLAVRSPQSAVGAWKEGLTMIKRNGQKLLNLTNQMLNLSKLEANAMPVHLVQGDVVAYLKYLVESFHSLAEAKNIRLEFSAQPEEIRMDFDPEKMQDIVSNLLSNAVKFTPQDGQVRVGVSKAAEQLVLIVLDTGAGISKEHLPRIFDRYFQADANGNLAEGTGLGLALTKELVKLLKGEIRVESTPGKGSVFTVRLPITNLAKQAQAPLTSEQTPLDLVFEKSEKAAHASVHRDGEKLVLLLVEDNADVLRYLRSLLADEYQIEEAGNGREGFEKAGEIIPDLVISDVMMPEMDGFAFCKKLKNDLRTSHIPVVLLTAKADAQSRVEGLEAGADAYLAKPFDKEELFVRVKKLIELRRALQARYSYFHETSETLPENGVFQKEDSFLQDVRRLLLDHLDDEEFGIGELGRSLGMSRSQLYRKFNALTDTTVHHFIRNLRLTKARELLLSTGLNVTEIAFETGFKNHSHFSRIFMEKFGVSPSQLRQGQQLDG